MPDPEDDKDKEEFKKQKLNVASIEAAMKAAALPVLINRFELINAPMPNHVILTLGGSLLGGYKLEGGEETEVIEARAHSAVLLSREAALLMSEKLKAHFDADAGEDDGEQE